MENGEGVEEAVAALHSIKEQSRAAHCGKHHVCMPHAADRKGANKSHNTGGTYNIKKWRRVAHCWEHDACTRDGDDGRKWRSTLTAIIITDGSAVVTVALNSIKGQCELHAAASMMRACMLHTAKTND